MNLRDLEYVHAVAKHRSFSKAAASCHVSQPALSNQIKKLEQELGATLFDRRVNEVQPTVFGVRVVDAAHQIILQTEKIRQIALEYRNQDTLPFKIGMTPTLAPYLTQYFSEMLSSLQEHTRVLLVENKPVELAEMVERQELDIALLSRKSHEMIYGREDKRSMEFKPLWQEPIYLGVRKGHPLAENQMIRAKNVPADLLIRFSIPFGYPLEKHLPEASDSIAEKTGFDVSAARFETVCRHISHSDDCTIINAVAAEQFKQDNWNLDFIEFEDEGNLRDLGIVYRPGYHRSELLDSIAAYVNETPPRGTIPSQ